MSDQLAETLLAVSLTAYKKTVYLSYRLGKVGFYSS